MKNTGKFITKEEREQLETSFKTSGMFLTGGKPMSNPQNDCADLCDKYNMDIEKYAISLKTGEFLQHSE